MEKINPYKNYSSIVPIEGNEVTNYRTIEAIGQQKSVLKSETADNIIANIPDLIDNPKYRPYFYKRLYALGPAKFLSVVDLARRGRYPARLFCSLLKKVT